VHDLEERIRKVAESVKSPVAIVEEKVSALAKRVKSLEKELEKVRVEDHTHDIDRMIADGEDIDGVRVVTARIECSGPKELREIGDRFRDRLKSGVVALGAESNGKAVLICLVTKDIAGSRVHAGKVIKEMAAVVGGGGGGRPDMAQAGGPDVSRLNDAINKAKGVIRNILV
jgi:alanyl-tRNA synthetase